MGSAILVPPLIIAVWFFATALAEPDMLAVPVCAYCRVPLIPNLAACAQRVSAEDPVVVLPWKTSQAEFPFSVPLWWEPNTVKKENRIELLQAGSIPYDEEWIVLLSYKFRTDSLFIDVGANVGRTSFPIVLQRGANHSIIAVEPVRRNINSLCQTLFYNHLPMGFGSKYQLIEGAASDKWGRMQIYVPEGRGDNAAMSESAAVKNVGGQAAPEEVTTFPLDDYLAQLRRKGNMPPGGLKGIKIDTQGYELTVLKGLSHTLATAQQLVVFAENDRGLMAAAGVNPADIISLMRGHGFKAYCWVDIAISSEGGREVMTVRGGVEQTANDYIPCGDIIWVKV